MPAYLNSENNLTNVRKPTYVDLEKQTSLTIEKPTYFDSGNSSVTNYSLHAGLLGKCVF
jgi:hypothetical protein